MKTEERIAMMLCYGPPVILPLNRLNLVRDTSLDVPVTAPQPVMNRTGNPRPRRARHGIVYPYGVTGSVRRSRPIMLNGTYTGPKAHLYGERALLMQMASGRLRAQFNRYETGLATSWTRFPRNHFRLDPTVKRDR